MHTKDIGRVRTTQQPSLRRTVANVSGGRFRKLAFGTSGKRKGDTTEDLTFVMLSPGSTETWGRRGVNCIPGNFLESCVHSGHNGDWQVISIPGVIRQLGGHSVFLQTVIWGKLRGMQGGLFNVANTRWPQCTPFLLSLV